MIGFITFLTRIARPSGRAISGCAVAIQRLQNRRRTYRALWSLDDRSLHDIGLDRSNVMSVSVHGRQRSLRGP